MLNVIIKEENDEKLQSGVGQGKGLKIAFIPLQKIGTGFARNIVSLKVI